MARGVHDHHEEKSRDTDGLIVWRSVDDEGNELSTYVEKHGEPLTPPQPLSAVTISHRWTWQHRLYAVFGGFVGAAVLETVLHLR